MRRQRPDQEKNKSGSELQEGNSPGDQRSFTEVAAIQKSSWDCQLRYTLKVWVTLLGYSEQQELVFILCIFISPQTAKKHLSFLYFRSFGLSFYSNRTMLENPFGVIAMLTARNIDKVVHPETLILETNHKQKALHHVCMLAFLNSAVMARSSQQSLCSGLSPPHFGYMLCTLGASLLQTLVVTRYCTEPF